MKYLSVGQTSLDVTVFPDKGTQGPYLGGTAIFGYGGIRLWDNDCAPVINVAADFEQHFGDWLRRSAVCRDYLKVVYDRTHTTNLVYQPDGNYLNTKTDAEKIKSAFDYGISNCRVEQLEQAGRSAQGVYLYLEPADLTFWRNLATARKQLPFELMWEPGFSKCHAGLRNRLLEIYDILRPEMSSLNRFEAASLFETDDLEQQFVFIEQLQIPFFFFRAGKSGAYALANGKRYFVPSIDIDGMPVVDPTGCGNTTTAAAMVGWSKTHNPVMATIMANIAGGFNVAQKGPIAAFTAEMQTAAQSLAISTYNRYIIEHPACLADGLSADGAAVLEQE